MKFDIVYSNPPYGSKFNVNLDIKILIHINEIFNEIIVVHPASWALDKKCVNNFGKFKKNISNNIILLEYFNGANIFNMPFISPLVISYISKNKNDSSFKVIDNVIKQNYICPNINNFTILGEDAFKIKYFDIIKKISKYDNLFNHIKEKNGKYLFRISNHKSGNPFFNSIIFDKSGFKLDKKCYFYSSICKSDKKKYHYEIRKPDDIILFFKTSNERENFYNYLKTKFIRFIAIFYKYNISFGSFKFVPWLDFTKKWDDKKLCEYFNIDKGQWKYIDHFINNLYDDYKSGFEENNYEI